MLGPNERGCEACVVQKKKCDLGKPACGRCARLKIMCVRSEQFAYKFVIQTKPKSKSRSSQLLHYKTSQARKKRDQHHDPLSESSQVLRANSRPLLSVIPSQPTYCKLRPEQVLYFDRFRNNLIFQLGSQSFDDFWGRTVLRESFRDDSVLEITLALGALSHALDGTGSGIPLYRATLLKNSNQYHNDALKYYTRSLTKFHSRISSGGTEDAKRRVLMSSILFSAFELLQGDMMSADKLMDHGVTILKDSILNSAWPDRQSQIAASCDDKGVEDAEYILMRRLTMRSLLMTLKNQERISKLISACSMPFTMAPVPPDLNQGFDLFWKQWMRFFTMLIMWYLQAERAAYSFISNDDIPLLLKDEQRHLLVVIAIWIKAVHERLEAEPDAYGRKILRKVVPGLMAIQLTISTTFSNKSLLSASSVQQAHKLFDLAESILEETSIFQAGLGEVYDDIQCMSLGVARIFRNREVRSRAMSLSRKTINAHSRWDAKEIFMACSAIVALEELGRDESGLIPVEKCYDWISSAWNDSYTELKLCFRSKRKIDGVYEEKEIMLRTKDFGLDLNSRQYSTTPFVLLGSKDVNQNRNI